MRDDRYAEGDPMQNHSIDWLGHQPTELIPRLRSLLADLEMIVVGGTYPTVKEPVGLEDWILMRRAVPCLAGRPTGHPDIRDGAAAVTSEIFLIDNKRKLARSMSRWYRLDDPMVDFPTPSFAERR